LALSAFITILYYAPTPPPLQIVIILKAVIKTCLAELHAVQYIKEGDIIMTLKVFLVTGTSISGRTRNPPRTARRRRHKSTEAAAKLTGCGESRSQLIQTSMVLHSRTSNLN